MLMQGQLMANCKATAQDSCGLGPKKTDACVATEMVSIGGKATAEKLVKGKKTTSVLNTQLTYNF